MITFLQIVCSLSVALAAVICLYHVFLAVVALLSRQRRESLSRSAVHDFAILIPAHNESGTIEQTLESCAELDYPSNQYTIYVIADNCEDDTADIADSFGATCLIRNDDRNRGKGQALEWAIPQVLEQQHDAVLILDADCLINRHALRTFDCQLTLGDKVMQAAYAVANPDSNSLSCLLAVANKLENDFFYAPKSILGLSVFLRGTGMLLHRNILLNRPWRASSVVEDAEYTYELLQAGTPISFVPNVRVVSDFPIQQDQLTVQRQRWVGGNIALGKRHGARLLWDGLLKCRLRLFDAGWTTMIVSRPLVILQLMLSLAIAFLCRHLLPDMWSTTLLSCSLAVVVLYGVYAAIGVVSLGVTIHRLKLLLLSPVVIGKYLWLSLRSLISTGPTSWNRTPRTQVTEQQ